MNCGHPPALVIRAEGDVEELGETSTVVGLFGNAELSTAATMLRAGDTLLLHTDGVTECLDSDGTEFGTERLVAILRRAGTLTASALLEEIVSELREFGGSEQQDDITLLVAQCLPV